MRVLSGTRTGELELSGTRAELLLLAERLAAPTAPSTALDPVPDPSPYDRALTRVVIVPDDAPVRFAPTPDGTAMEIRGTPAARAGIAANLAAFAADAAATDHLHLDWFPDHPWLAEDSAPLVVAVHPA